jgi:hypothetical protein
LAVVVVAAEPVVRPLPTVAALVAVALRLLEWVSALVVLGLARQVTVISGGRITPNTTTSELLLPVRQLPQVLPTERAALVALSASPEIRVAALLDAATQINLVPAQAALQALVPAAI